MLRVVVVSKNKQKQFDHPEGAIEFGRGPKREARRCVIRDPFVSKDHLRVREVAAGRVFLENLSQRNAVWLADGSTIAAGESREALLPVQLSLGETQIDLQDAASDEKSSFHTIEQSIIRKPETLQAPPPLAALGESPSPEVLARWFETMVAVQQAAASSGEFYAQTARAVVDLVGLDSGMVLLRQGNAWEPVASFSARPGHEASFSRTVLKYMADDQRTFFQAPDSGFSGESLVRPAAVVASPIFDEKGEAVVGAVYGSRANWLGGKPAKVTPLEAQMIQVLASAVGVGLARMNAEAEMARLRVSMDVAREVQSTFFPTTLPRIAGYELAASVQPAEATGGDYYDVIPQGGGRYSLVVADVCGHGLGPSLVMASVRALLRGLALRDLAPEVLMTDLSAGLYEDLKRCRRFTTLMYGILDPGRHRFEFANAGHGPVALHYRARENRFTLLAEDDSRGCPLGVLREQYKACMPADLAPGDLLLLGSDGLTETRRGTEQFGMERLQAVLRDSQGQGLQGIIDTLIRATNAFRGHPRLDDDLTMLLVRRV